MNDQVLIQAACQGDLDSFNQLALNYQDLVYRQACHIMGKRAPAEDMTQEAFILAYKKLSTFRGGSFRSWLLRIVTHVCYDELRRLKRRPAIPLIPYTAEDEEVESPVWLVDPSPSPEETLERVQLGSVLQHYLDELSPPIRAAVVLVDVQGCDYEEAASVLRIPLGTLKSRLARARLFLRSRLSLERGQLTDWSRSRGSNDLRMASRAIRSL